jgi:Fe2+ transport system protein FeoA
VPGAEVEIVSFAPFEGPVSVRTNMGDQAISRELAARVSAATI